MGKAYIFACAAAVLAAHVVSCSQTDDSGLQAKVDEYAVVEVTSPMIKTLSDKDMQVLNLFRSAGRVIDGLFWQQTFGDRDSLLESLTDPAAKDYALINYGPWDRLADNEHADGNLKCVWYRDEYRAQLDEICRYLEEAASITENEGLRNYLTKRVEAFRTDDYLESDLAWMDMKDSKIDIVIGPIENYDDKLNEAKASYECFILLKDEERSAELAKYVSMLPELQKMLPCRPEYKTFVPGTSSDLNVYDAIYYSGDCNAGSKTIAINLPNDERVHAAKGTRRLQLHNSITAKFGKILLPIGRLLIEPEQRKHLRDEAFFWNVTFHEVAHGLGVKETVNGKGTVDEALGTEKTTWEEAKADILGLFMVCRLVDMKEIPLITKEDAITTFIAGLVRSVRFGSASSHGRANMMCYNYLKENGAFSRNKDGLYHIDYEKALAAINSWADLILTVQAEGNYEFAKEYAARNAVIPEALAADIANVNAHGIPRDIRFEFVW